MKVILTERVKTLGNVGEIVNVSEGYARNFLIPQEKAVIADSGNKANLENHKKRLANKINEEKKEAEAIKKKVDGMKLTLSRRVGGNGKLFGTITNAELAKELEKNGVHLERRQIIITDPIKQLGEFKVKAKIFTDVEATFTVKVEIDQNQAEEMRKAQAAAEARKKAKKEEPAAEEAKAEGEEENSEENAE